MSVLTAYITSLQVNDVIFRENLPLTMDRQTKQTVACLWQSFVLNWTLARNVFGGCRRHRPKAAEISSRLISEVFLSEDKTSGLPSFQLLVVLEIYFWNSPDKFIKFLALDSLLHLHSWIRKDRTLRWPLVYRNNIHDMIHHVSTKHWNKWDLDPSGLMIPV